jgi:predicted amidophosphoribosyltransferase
VSLSLFLNLLAPVKCVVCSQSGTLLCHHIEPREPTRCQLGDLAGWYLLELQDELLRALQAFKDRSITALAPQLWTMFSPIENLECWQDAELLLIPASSARAFRERGYVPLKLLLRFQSKRVVMPSRLRRLKNQRTLGPVQRRENLSGAFRFTGISGKRVLLVDDVLTTGATLHELHRAALEAGASVIGFCVLARRISENQNMIPKKA